MSDERNDTALTPPNGTHLVGAALGDIGRRVVELGGDVLEAGRLAPTLEREQLGAFLFENEESARELGDALHNFARQLNTIRNELSRRK